MKLNLLFKSASIYIVTGVANSAIPFILLPILTRVLSPSEYGKIVMFSSAFVVISSIVCLSVHGSVSVKYFDINIDHPRYLATSLMVVFPSAMFCIFFIIVFSNPLSRYVGISHWWLIFAALASVAQFIVQLRLLMWQVSHNAFKYGVFVVSQTVMNLAISLFFVLGLSYGWEGRGVGIVLSMFLFGIVAFLSMQVAGMLRWKFSFMYAKSMLKFGIPLIPHSVGGLLMSMTDRFAISALIGIEEAGVYAAAMQIGLIVFVVSDACNKSFAPWLFSILSKNDESEKIKIVKYTYFLFFAIPVLAYFFGKIAPWLLQFVVGSQYQSGSGAVLFIALGGGFGAMYYLVANYVFYAEKTGALACVTLFSGVVNVVLAMLLVKANGSVGAAQAYMASQIICFFLTWIIAGNVYSMPWKFFIWK
ncbi:polysaccharide biosynthesis protein [Desulfomicrobium baculatum DSM 4028]|uniref:Polysaccharide biosynthesis protein n=2 Tax=Desulfomicrobium baculatum TaxID=899 RepID=C7LP17_DESBD|nr:polysaccharide biosynthesis protein [Desulfomicrobium baculatum DSM 4028]